MHFCSAELHKCKTAHNMRFFFHFVACAMQQSLSCVLHCCCAIMHGCLCLSKPHRAAHRAASGALFCPAGDIALNNARACPESLCCTAFAVLRIRRFATRHCSFDDLQRCERVLTPTPLTRTRLSSCACRYHNIGECVLHASMIVFRCASTQIVNSTVNQRSTASLHSP